jgi:serine/threonine protein kinase
MADRSPPEPARQRPASRDGTSASSSRGAQPRPSDHPTGPADQSTLAGGSPTPPALTGNAGIIPDFELLKELGRGGNGIVFKARQNSLDRMVAVKLLPASRAKDATILARFIEEARAAASITHPNIVAVHEVGECPAGHFFVMEYVQGSTLQALLDQRGTEKLVPILWSAEVLITLAQAVHHAHTRGIFHRDLKPSNIIIERLTGRPVVLDFGIARRLDKANPAATAVGTPCYMSPEQAGEAVGSPGSPSDVYALGAILYRMLTGRLPFEATNTIDTLLLVAGPAMPEPPRDLRPEVPLPLNVICMKCLNKKPEDRYQSCEALAKELKSFLAVPSATPAPPTVQRRPPAMSAPAAPPAPTGPAVVLQVEESGKQVRLSKSISVIGRGVECDLVIKRADVSKRHCRILLDADGALVEDLESTSGTSVNGEPITRKTLYDGDVLEVASYTFRVKVQLPKRR